MTRLIAFILATGISMAVLAEENGELKDPKEILTRADKAVRAPDVVSFTMTTEQIEGQNPNSPKKMHGPMIIGGESLNGFDRYRANLTVEPHDGAKREFSAGSDGKTFFLIDPAAKKMYKGPRMEVFGSNAMPVQFAIVREFSHPRPFGDELEGESTLKAITRIADEACYEVAVKYQQGLGEATWWISTRDFLPRQVDRIFMIGGARSVARTTISDLKIDPKFEDNPFEAKLPEGYELVEGAAP